LLLEIRAGGHTQVERPDSELAQCTWVADLPVIVLDAAPQEADLLRAFEAGADDFLARPVSYLELRGFVSSTAGTAISSRGLGKMAHFGYRDTQQFRARLASKSRAKSR
jgi:CheY-like chemotaxis protein